MACLSEPVAELDIRPPSGWRIMKWALLQAWVLRMVGVVEMLAFGAVFLPRAWMESIHNGIGLTEMPKGPVFDSVMRQVSYTYGVHGVALWIIAADVGRYRPFVILTTIGYLLAGPVFFLVDLANGMPWSWIVGNGGSCLLIGTLLLGLLYGERTTRKGAKATTHEKNEASLVAE
jgi:hypothetical protein